MWSREQGRVKLDISKVREDFRIVSQDGLHFVSPKRNVWDWEEEEKWLRSIVVDDNGFVVSSGWPKFGNYSEFAKDTEILNRALEDSEPIKFSHKEDGSLCIRSVINGQVVFRSRGTLYGGDEDGLGNSFFNVSKNKYPKLLDPAWMADCSLLFEYVSPDNFVVIRYEKEDLIFIGSIKHSELSICTWEEMEAVSKEGDLNLVRLHVLPRNLKELLKEIEDWTDEGVVVRCNNDRTFVKIKSASYLFNHKMRFSLTYSLVVNLIYDSGAFQEEELVSTMRKMDYDWEVIEEAKKFYHRFISAHKEAEKLLETAKELCDRFWSMHDISEKKNPLIRKEFASFAKVQVGNVRSMMFLLYDNDQEKIYNLCKKIVLTNGK